MPREMPPFGSKLTAMRDFYRLEFLDDGYPARREGDGTLFAHPIYGTYVLVDYNDQYRKTGSSDYAEALKTVARAAINRMSDHERALVFWYEADPTNVARSYERHYSGLTQGYYALQLYRTGRLIDDPELIEAAERVFASLMVPAEKGGVLYESPLGTCIAELPQAPNSWILNGWMSALVSVHEYAEASGSEVAADLLARSAATVARVLPLYDVPDLYNSRYGLTGFTYVRFRFDHSGLSLHDVAVTVPGEGTFEVPVGRGTRWQPWVVADDLVGSRPSGGAVRASVVLSLASSPQPNVISARVDLEHPSKIVLEGMRGDYDPVLSAPANSRWELLDSIELPRGTHSVHLEVPISFIHNVAYPTNFAKKINGTQTNIYHAMHVSRLWKLAEHTRQPELAQWADRWYDYICQWSDMQIYDGTMVRNPVTDAIERPEQVREFRNSQTND